MSDINQKELDAAQALLCLQNGNDTNDSGRATLEEACLLLSCVTLGAETRASPEQVATSDSTDEPENEITCTPEANFEYIVDVPYISEVVLTTSESTDESHNQINCAPVVDVQQSIDDPCTSKTVPTESSSNNTHNITLQTYDPIIQEAIDKALSCLDNLKEEYLILSKQVRFDNMLWSVISKIKSDQMRRRKKKRNETRTSEDVDKRTGSSNSNSAGEVAPNVQADITNANTDEMVPIGDGSTLIPARVLRHIDWNAYTTATRKLLTAVFPRKVLATSSLTGKGSPAFKNKPAKVMLDQVTVNNIVRTVVEKCGVPENIVRNCVTTKCADEAKMFRNRQNKKLSRNGNKENKAPDAAPYDDPD